VSHRDRRNRRGALNDREFASSSAEESLATLYADGMVCDSGNRRNGTIVFILRERCDRCSPLSTNPVTSIATPDRLPCSSAERDKGKVLDALCKCRVDANSN